MTKNEEYRINKKERILKIAIKDSLKTSRICLILVSIFELWFMIYWFLRDKSFSDISDLKYFICYVFLFLCSIIALILSFIFSKNYDKDYRKMNLVYNIYGVIIILY